MKFCNYDILGLTDGRSTCWSLLTYGYGNAAVKSFICNAGWNKYLIGLNMHLNYNLKPVIEGNYLSST